MFHDSRHGSSRQHLIIEAISRYRSTRAHTRFSFSLTHPPFSPTHLLNGGLVSLCGNLSNTDEGSRAILLGHKQLDELDDTSIRELLVQEQMFEISLCPGLVIFALFGVGAEYVEELCVLPRRDVVVARVHAVDHPLNRVALVVDDEADGC